MQIKSVKLHDFRMFSDLLVEFDKVSWLVWQNGEGKTTILEALNYATTKQWLQYKLSDSDFRNWCNSFEIELLFDTMFICPILDWFQTKDIPCKWVLLRVKRREKSSGKALNDWFVISHFCIPICYENITEIWGIEWDFPISVKLLNAEKYQYEAPRKSWKPLNISDRHLRFSGDIKWFPNVFYFDKNRERQSSKGYNTTLYLLGNRT